MTEPREIAPAAEEVAPGLWTWSISNSNIGGHISSSQALLTREGCVLIDPVRLDDAALGALPRPTAILLTARCHQRAAWRYRRELGAQVWLPEDAAAADEAPDHTYADGQVLPGGLRAFRTPGPEWPHYSFISEADPGILFCSDLLSGDADRRAALHRPGVPRGSRGDPDQRGAAARPAVRHPVPGARGAGRGRPEGRAARGAGAELMLAAPASPEPGALAHGQARAPGDALRVAGGVARRDHVPVPAATEAADRDGRRAAHRQEPADERAQHAPARGRHPHHGGARRLRTAARRRRGREAAPSRRGARRRSPGRRAKGARCRRRSCRRRRPGRLRRSGTRPLPGEVPSPSGSSSVVAAAYGRQSPHSPPDSRRRISQRDDRHG